MNFSKLLLVTMVTAGALSLTGQAAAFAPIWPADGDNAEGADPAGSVVIWHSGATASTSSLQTAVIEAFCDLDPDGNPGTINIDVLEDDRSLNKPDFWSVACIIKAGIVPPVGVPALTAGNKLLWNKRDEGGSGVGVGPVEKGRKIGFMKPSTGANTNCPAVTTSRPQAGTTVNVWKCGTVGAPSGFNVPVVPPLPTPPLTDPIGEASATADGVLRAPDIGTSDIEPDKFASVYLENVPISDLNLDGFKGVSPGDDLPAYTGTTFGLVSGLAQLIFNTPVNLLMYQDLQRAQFPSGHALFNDCNPAGIAYNNNVAIVGSSALSSSPALLITTFNTMGNTEKCMPSLTASEIRSIFGTNGAIRRIADFQGELGTGVFTELTGTGTTDDTIQICRRVEGSGTQAQFNAMLMGYPCDPNAADGSIDTLRPEGEGNFTLFVTENESSGDVEKCLNDYNNGTNTNANATNKNTLLRKRWAIGIQSLEKNVPTAGTALAAGVYSNQYRFIKIDGFAPTLVNAHAGDYINVARQSLQYKTGALAPIPAAFAALKPFVELPSKLPALNKTHAFGISGWLATPATTLVPESFLPDSKLNFSRPVAWFRRVSFNAGVSNTCALPSAFKKATLTPAVFGNPDLLTATAITVGPQNCSSNGGAPPLLGADQNCYTGILGTP